MTEYLTAVREYSSTYTVMTWGFVSRVNYYSTTISGVLEWIPGDRPVSVRHWCPFWAMPAATGGLTTFIIAAARWWLWLS
jgi:hypothetical protein